MRRNDSRRETHLFAQRKVLVPREKRGTPPLLGESKFFSERISRLKKVKYIEETRGRLTEEEEENFFPEAKGAYLLSSGDALTRRGEISILQKILSRHTLRGIPFQGKDRGREKGFQKDRWCKDTSL